ncbi:hypothetical protein AVDCRST_MAG84-3415 [uncultured Microcoleus sp.]|uniref:Uncharacterized protein n=1 Tax=uncultured Microcoleus sp. TaxID=259945 RepID=A0A6J4MI12_9CYAN|nr:hypothetical protein AVDCRST_MAG84-3415 [uncultured Microcoleus sp.]
MRESRTAKPIYLASCSDSELSCEINKLWRLSGGLMTLDSH